MHLFLKILDKSDFDSTNQKYISVQNISVTVQNLKVIYNS